MLAKFLSDFLSDVVLETFDQGTDEIGDVGGGIGDEWGEIDSENDLRGGIGGMRIEEGGVCGASANDGEIVALPTSNLGIEHSIDGGGEVVAATDVHEDFLIVWQPIEISPDLAAYDLAGALVLGKLAHGLDGGDGDTDMGIVFIGGVVSVNDLGLSGAENG